MSGDWTDDTDQMILIMDTLLELKGDLDPVNFGKKLSHWLSFGKFEFQSITNILMSYLGFPELSDEGGSGCGRTTYNVLSAPDFKTDPHKVRAKTNYLRICLQFIFDRLRKMCGRRRTKMQLQMVAF